LLRLADPGTLNQNIVILTIFGETSELKYKISAKSAANTAVLHFYKFLLGSRVGSGSRWANEVGVHIHSGHVIDDDGNTKAMMRAVEDVLENVCLAGALKIEVNSTLTKKLEKSSLIFDQDGKWPGNPREEW
jgi:hypothetical protein